MVGRRDPVGGPVEGGGAGLDIIDWLVGGGEEALLRVIPVLFATICLFLIVVSPCILGDMWISCYQKHEEEIIRNKHFSS